MNFITNYATIISITCTIITCVIAFLSYKSNFRTKSNQELTDRVTRDTQISTKLDLVITGNAEVKSEMKNLNNKFDEMSDRLARCEESTKHAHDRLDKLELKFR